ncbi:hypothetical protein OA46_20065 [Enterobacter cloacae]|nr:hypothetical protein OA46_20065 [Enterobacter cloacae]
MNSDFELDCFYIQIFIATIAGLVRCVADPQNRHLFKSWLAGGAVSALAVEHISKHQHPLATGSGKVSQWQCS